MIKKEGAAMKKISELKSNFENFVLEKSLENGIVVNKFSFFIPKELEDSLDSLLEHAHEFSITLILMEKKSGVGFFEISYNFENGTRKETPHIGLLLFLLQKHRVLPDLYPAVRLLYSFRSFVQDSVLQDIEKYKEVVQEILQYEVHDKSSVELSLLMKGNIEFDFEYYGDLL